MTSTAEERVQAAYDAAVTGDVAATPNGVVVRLGWTDAARRTPVEMFQVLRMRDGRVVDMQDHEQRRAALKGLGAAG